MKRLFRSLTAFALALMLVLSINIPSAKADSVRPADDDFAGWYTALCAVFADDNFAAYVANEFTKESGLALTDYPVATYPSVEEVLTAYTGNIDASYKGASHAWTVTQNKLNAAFEPDITLGKVASVDDVLFLPNATSIDLTDNLIYDLTPLALTEKNSGYFGHIIEGVPSRYIDTTINLNGNPLTVWPAEFCGHIQLVTNNRSYPVTTLHFINNGNTHSIKVPLSITASGVEGAYIYQPVEPNAAPTGATWTKGSADIGANVNDENSNLLTNVVISGITSPGNFSFGYTTSFSSRFLFNKFTSTGLTTQDKLTYSLDYPFNVVFYDEYVLDITNENAVVLTKTDADTEEALEGAFYAIYSGTPDGEHELYGIYNTDENGQIILGGLPDGDYYFIETETPGAEYKLNREAITFSLDSDEVITGSTEITSENGSATVALTREAGDGDALSYQRNAENATGYVSQPVTSNVTSANGINIPNNDTPVITTDFYRRTNNRCQYPDRRACKVLHYLSRS